MASTKNGAPNVRTCSNFSSEYTCLFSRLHEHVRENDYHLNLFHSKDEFQISVPHPDMFGAVGKVWVPKNNTYIPQAILPCIIYVKTKCNSLQILKNKNLFKRHKYPSLNSSNMKYFWNTSPTMGAVSGITKSSAN